MQIDPNKNIQPLILNAFYCEENIRNMNFRFYVFFVLGAFLNSCIPFPLSVIDSPDIEGKLYRDGVVVEDVSVGVIDVENSDEDKCKGITPKTYTDMDGRFKLSEIRKKNPVLLLPVDPLESWGLCFNFPDGAKAVWLYADYSAPEKQYLECYFGGDLDPSSPLVIVSNAEESPIGSDQYDNICYALNSHEISEKRRQGQEISKEEIGPAITIDDVEELFHETQEEIE